MIYIFSQSLFLFCSNVVFLSAPTMEEKNKEEKEEKKKEEEKEEEKMKQQQPKNKKGLLVLMRHSLRVDKNAHAKWVDKLSRPYDSPIENTIILPRKQTKNIINNVFVDNNIGVGFDVVYVSPFRRCLQTAGLLWGGGEGRR